MTDFSDSIKAQLFSFKKHPFAFYFCVSWISLNWKGLIYLFSDISADEKIDKITKIHDTLHLSIPIFNVIWELPPYLIFWILLPLILATLIVFAFNPIVAKTFYKKQLSTDFVFKDIRRTIESEERLTKDESNKLKLKLIETETKHVYVDSNNKSLEAQNRDLEAQLKMEKENKEREIKLAVNEKSNENDLIKNKLTDQINSLNRELTGQIGSLNNEIFRLKEDNNSAKDELKKYHDLEDFKTDLENALEFLWKKFNIINLIKNEAYINDFMNYAREIELAKDDPYRTDEIIKTWGIKKNFFKNNLLINPNTGQLLSLGIIIYRELKFKEPYRLIKRETL